MTVKHMYTREPYLYPRLLPEQIQEHLIHQDDLFLAVEHPLSLLPQRIDLLSYQIELELIWQGSEGRGGYHGRWRCKSRWWKFTELAENRGQANEGTRPPNTC